MTTKENNMGNMSQEEAIEFFSQVKDSLGESVSLDFTTAGSICIGDTIFLDYRDLQYPWYTKQMILHEIAHHLVPEDYTHGTKFHQKYAYLVSRFLAGMVPLLEED